MVVVVLALVGGVLGFGALGWTGGGFLVGAVIGALVGWTADVRDRLSKAERRLAKLEKHVDSERARTPAEQGAPVPATQGLKSPTPAVSEAGQPSEPATAFARAARPPEHSAFPATPSPAAPPPSTSIGPPAGDATPPRGDEAEHAAAPSARPPAPRGARAEPAPPGALDVALEYVKRWFTTGNVPVKVGVVLSVFGVGFLIKAGVDRGWLVLPIEYRLMLVALFGIALLAIGWRLRGRERTYALSMQGGGIAVLYLTIYASFAQFSLLPGTAAFGLLLVVTAAAGTLAVLQDAKALAVLGIVGGFLAPVLTSDGGGNHVALFSYYAILNLAIVGVAWFKAWRVLNVLGFAFTFGIGGLWGYDAYRPELFGTTEPFLVLFVLLYMLIPVLFATARDGGSAASAGARLRPTARDGGSAADAAGSRPSRRAPQLRGFVDGTLVFGTPLVGFALQSRLVADTQYGLAISAIVLAALYVGIATYIYRRGAPELRVLVEAQLAMGVVFLTVAIPLALDARWTSAAWAVQGAALAWLGFRQNRKLALAMGLALQLLAAAAYTEQARVGGELPWVNGYLLGALLLAFAAGFSARLFDVARGALADTLRGVRGIVAAVLLLWATGWWLFAGFTEIERQLPRDSEIAVGLVFGAATTLLAMLGARQFAWPRLEAVALVSWPIAAFALVTTPFSLAHPVEGYGWIAWPALLGAQFVFLRRCESRFPMLRGALHTTAYWLVAVLLAWETAWSVERVTTGDTWPLSAAFAVSAALVLATLRLRDRVGWPLAEHSRLYVVAAAGGVLAALLVAVLGANLTLSGDAAPLPYVPVLNPLEVASLFVLVVFAHWLTAQQRERGGFALAPAHRAAAAGVLGWFLLTMAVARAVHHYAGVPFDLDALASSTTLQAALSIVWGATALTAMTLGTRNRRRAVWLAGAGLMAVVVVKLFLVDLGNAGTLGRIVSFLGVGVLLLIVGYFAPVPPRTEPDRGAVR